jgi:hypothetical protein
LIPFNHFTWPTCYNSFFSNYVKRFLVPSYKIRHLQNSSGNWDTRFSRSIVPEDYCFLDVLSFSLVDICQRFGGTCCFHPQDERIVWWKWRQQVPVNCWYLFATQHGITPKKTIIFISGMIHTYIHGCSLCPDQLLLIQKYFIIWKTCIWNKIFTLLTSVTFIWSFWWSFNEKYIKTCCFKFCILCYKIIIFKILP